jgi:hypothetical protein
VGTQTGEFGESFRVPVGHGYLGAHRDQRAGHGPAGDPGTGHEYRASGKLHH